MQCQGHHFEDNRGISSGKIAACDKRESGNDLAADHVLTDIRYFEYAAN
jgi:hypothetical protein